MREPLPPSLSRTLEEDSGRPAPRGEQARERRQIPDRRISLNSLHLRDADPKTYQSGVADQLASEPEEGLLKVVVGLGRDVVVLEVLFPVERDGLGLDLALLDVDLVTAENDRDVLADTGQIT